MKSMSSAGGESNKHLKDLSFRIISINYLSKRKIIIRTIYRRAFIVKLSLEDILISEIGRECIKIIYRWTHLIMKCVVKTEE